MANPFERGPEREKTCPDCKADPKKMGSCKTCNGKGWVVGK